MLRASSRSNVCWKCLAQSQNGLSARTSRVTRQLHISQKLQQVNGSHHDLSQLDLGPSAIPSILSKRPEKVDERPLRERLRDWVSDAPAEQLMADVNFYGKVTNSNTRPQSTGTVEMDNFDSELDTTIGGPMEAGVESAEPAIVNKTRNPGDLVEMRQLGSRTPLIGVYLGYFGERNHFYASNGKWIISMGYSSFFSISNFATLDEVKPILATIPKHAKPDGFEALRRDDKGPSRAVGGPLIEKMTKFVSESESIYHNILEKLDGAKDLLADKRKPKYMSLFEIADVMLPASRKKAGKFSPQELYAVHTALYQNDFIFRPVSPSAAAHRKDHMFEIVPSYDHAVIDRVSALVREYSLNRYKNDGIQPNPGLAGTAIGDFVSKAQELVQGSRAKREWTPHGILSPSSVPTLETGDWLKASRDIIQFLKWWACYDLFEESSRFHAYGSLILRALDLYPGAILDQTTAWTFLQEIGAIPSWELPSRYKVRLPGTIIEPGGGLIRDAPIKLEESRRADVADGARKSWDNQTVFCIDALSTVLIDDGISLERTDKPDEFWLHVHAADPASGIQPKSELSHYMELIPENIYLPGHFQAMLPSETDDGNSKDWAAKSLTDAYSLAPDRPALTFRAKLNEAGELLDYKVEAGVVKEVVYLEPDDVSKFCNEPEPPTSQWTDKLEVGQLPEDAAPVPNRPMTAAKDLDEASQEDLRVLYKLSRALRQKRLDKGAWPFFFPRPSIDVSFPKVSAEDEPATSKTARLLPPDPYIKVSYESSMGAAIVSNTMVLAGEIAARWCADRGIPLPYRKDAISSNLRKTVKFANEKIYPLIEKGIEPTMELRQQLSRLTGGIELSSTPGPYFMLGLDMYAKATSPLRRFSDLIVHWQVHAALAHERQVQRRLDPKIDDLDTILPFTSKTMGDTLSQLEMREKMARHIAHGSRDWILIALVRAWRYEKTLTRPLRFTVDSRWRFGLTGHVDFFGLSAIMDLDGLDGRALIKDIRIGDMFDVELADVNVHTRQIFVKTIKYLGSGKLDTTATTEGAPKLAAGSSSPTTTITL